MSKEYLEELTNKIRYKKEHIRDDLYRLYIKKNEIEFLEKELQRLEAIDNSNPSEALKYFEELGVCELKQSCLVEDLIVYDTVKQALLKAQSLEKENAKYKRVLNIIKEKNVDTRILRNCLKDKTPKHYNFLNDKHQLTQEEFDLLKEMLKNE